LRMVWISLALLRNMRWIFRFEYECTLAFSFE
jgi:hypothetical protein